MAEDRAVGCLFCVTGKESYVARQLEALHPDVRAMVAMKEKHKIVGGRRLSERTVMLPGYVFFEAPGTLTLHYGVRLDSAIRLLTVDGETWQLSGRDRQFVQWLFERDGLLEKSVVYREDDQIRIVSGPLKELEGKVRKIDRRGGRGLVEIDFDGKVFMVWLSFDTVAPRDTKDRMQDAKI